MLLLLSLTACGFEPLYGTQRHGGGNSPLASVGIDPIDGLIGRQFAAALEDRFSPEGPPARPPYGLAVQLKTSRIPTVIEPDGTVSRYNLQLDSTFRLYRKADGEAIETGHLRRTTSYNLSDADFSDFVAESDAVRRAIAELSEAYRMRFAALFHRREGAP